MPEVFDSFRKYVRAQYEQLHHCPALPTTPLPSLQTSVWRGSDEVVGIRRTPRAAAHTNWAARAVLNHRYGGTSHLDSSSEGNELGPNCFETWWRLRVAKENLANSRANSWKRDEQVCTSGPTFALVATQATTAPSAAKDHQEYTCARLSATV